MKEPSGSYPMTGFPDSPSLNEIDWHLYFAKAMPFRHRALLRLALWMNASLRREAAETKKEIEAYLREDAERLGRKCFGTRPSPEGNKVSPARVFGGFWESSFGLRPGLAMAAAALVVAVGLWPRQGAKIPAQDFTAKGNGLEMRLFIKGLSLRPATDDPIQVSIGDTLQIMPMPGAQPHLAIFGWDSEQGLSLVFPKAGKVARKISVDEPPPGLVLTGSGESRLICVSHSAPFSLDSTLRVLSGMGLASEKKPFTPPMPSGWKLQTFTVRETP